MSTDDKACGVSPARAAAALLLSFDRLPLDQRREAIRAWIEWQTAVGDEMFGPVKWTGD